MSNVGIAPVHLERKVWRDSIRRKLREMLFREDGGRRYSAGPFQAGWELAIEEIAMECGIDFAALETEGGP